VCDDLDWARVYVCVRVWGTMLIVKPPSHFLSHECDLTDIWHDSSKYDMTHPYTHSHTRTSSRIDVYITLMWRHVHVTWLIQMWHDSSMHTFAVEPRWCIHHTYMTKLMRDTTHPNLTRLVHIHIRTHDHRAALTYTSHLCDVTYTWHDSSKCDMTRPYTYSRSRSSSCVDVYVSCVDVYVTLTWYDLHVTWLIHTWHDSSIRDMTHSCIWCLTLQSKFQCVARPSNYWLPHATVGALTLQVMSGLLSVETQIPVHMAVSKIHMWTFVYTSCRPRLALLP